MSQKPSLMMFASLVGTIGALPAHATLGPGARVCATNGPAMLIRVVGLKNRVGMVRVRAFAGDPANYFHKGYQFSRIELPIPARGPVEICVPVPRAGAYAVDVRHDTNGDGKTDFSDGIGLSGNPKLSLLDVMFKRQPPANQVQVRVMGGTVATTVQLRYRG